METEPSAFSVATGCAFSRASSGVAFVAAYIEAIFHWGVTLGHVAAAVVIHGCAPEVRARNGFEHLSAAPAVAGQAALEIAEEHAEMLAVHACVEIAANDAQWCVSLVFRRFLNGINTLRKRDFIAALRPRSIRLQAEGERHRIFSRRASAGQTAGHIRGFPSAARRFPAAREAMIRRCAPEWPRSQRRPVLVNMERLAMTAFVSATSAMMF